VLGDPLPRQDVLPSNEKRGSKKPAKKFPKKPKSQGELQGETNQPAVSMAIEQDTNILLLSSRLLKHTVSAFM
jgi:hypothetical protein